MTIKAVLKNKSFRTKQRTKEEDGCGNIRVGKFDTIISSYLRRLFRIWLITEKQTEVKDR